MASMNWQHRHEEELRLHQAVAAARGEKRSAIVRKQLRKELQRLRKDGPAGAASASTGGSGSNNNGGAAKPRKGASWGAAGAAPDVLCEVVMTPESGFSHRDFFVPLSYAAPGEPDYDENDNELDGSVAHHHGGGVEYFSPDRGSHLLRDGNNGHELERAATPWPRGAAAEKQLELLKRPECPLSRRVVVWEPLDLDGITEEERHRAQQRLLRAPRASADAGAATEPELEPHATDPAAFRDLALLAERLDARYGGMETTIKLTRAKPPASAPEHADCIVHYLGPSENRERIAGVIIYDVFGEARVDVNFQHHHKVHGVWRIPSGHWHILAPGNHTHESGIEQHFGPDVCPWLWLAIPVAFAAAPNVPIGQ